MGEFENTLIMVISDNGASAEGGPNGSVNENKFFNNVPDNLQQNLAAIDDIGGPKYFNHYPWGWTFAGNTPFRRWKRETYRGGISDPFIVHWPKGIKAKGEIRTQYATRSTWCRRCWTRSASSRPTSIRGVTQSPMEGFSFAHAFDDAKAPAQAHHAVLRDVRPPLDLPRRLARGVPVARHVVHGIGPAVRRADRRHDADRARCRSTGSSITSTRTSRRTNNLADNEPRQADRDDRHVVRRGRQVQRAADRQPRHAAPRRAASPARRRSQELSVLPGHADRADQRGGEYLEPAATASPWMSRFPKAGAEGVLLSQGGNDGGFSFYVQGGKLHYAYNYVADTQYHLESKEAVPAGRHKLRYEFEPTGKPDVAKGLGAPGRGQLYIDGKLVGQVDLAKTIPLCVGLGGGVTAGADPGSPVTELYKPPYTFTGTIHTAVIDVSGELIKDDDATMRMAMARQ